MDSINIGKFEIKTNSAEEVGIYTNAKNSEEQGSMRRYLIDGVGNFSIIIQLVEFEDGAAIVGLEGDYVGPRFIYTNLYSRLRIGMDKYNTSRWCELRVPKESTSKPGRLTAQKTSLENLDEDFGLNSAQNVLHSIGVTQIDTRENILNDESNRKNQIIACWDPTNLLVPVGIFVITRLIPVMHLLVNIQNGVKDIVYFGPKSISEESYSLENLLLKDENSNLEFKKSAFFSSDEKTNGNAITHDLERNIVGMLNGVVNSHILIGIDKNNEKIGVANDFNFVTSGMSGWDGYLLVIRNSLINLLGISIVTNCISIGWHDIGQGKDNPVVDIFIRPVPEGQDLTTDRDGQVWIRTLNATQKPYTEDELSEYIRNRLIR